MDALWVEALEGDISWEPGRPAGAVRDIQHLYVSRPPCLTHATCPWRGNRVVLVGHHIRNPEWVSQSDHSMLDFACMSNGHA